MRRTILVVDDDVQVQVQLRFFLEQSGFFVQVCGNGFDAIDLMKNNVFDLLVLDITMPHVNGFKMLKSLSLDEKLKDIPVLMLTASKHKEDLIKAKEFGVVDYVIKPAHRQDFVARVERVLGGRPQFESVEFKNPNEDVAGCGQLAFALKSISSRGMILVSECSVPKGYAFNLHQFKFFQDLRIKKTAFTVADCIPQEDGKFEYFISFFGLSAEDQETIRNWVIAESFRVKNGRGTAA